MSRAYDFAVEVSPVKADGEADFIVQEVENELGAHSIDFWHEENTATKTLFIDGSTTLCGGESDDEAAYRLRKAIVKKFPTVKEIVSKWRCMEYLEWDNEVVWNAEEEDEEEE